MYEDSDEEPIPKPQWNYKENGLRSENPKDDQELSDNTPDEAFEDKEPIDGPSGGKD